MIDRGNLVNFMFLISLMNLFFCDFSYL